MMITTHANLREIPCPQAVGCGYAHHEPTGTGYLECDACSLHLSTASLAELTQVHIGHLRVHAEDLAAAGIDLPMIGA